MADTDTSTAPAAAATPAPTSRTHSGWLILAWLAFFLTTALPASLCIVLLSWIAAWCLVTYGLLDTGGFTMSEHSFMVRAWIGLALALLSAIGAGLRRLTGRDAQGQQRQRVIGPGGRVLRIFYNKGQAAPPSGVLTWFPDLATVLSLALLCAFARLVGARWLSAGLCVAFLIASLHLLALYIPWLGWKGLRLSFGLYRFASATPFRTGVFTILFLIPPVGLISRLVQLDSRALSQPAPRATDEDSAPSISSAALDRASDHMDLAEVERLLLVFTADSLWPGPTFDAQVRLFLLPWFTAARDPYRSQDELSLGADPASPWSWPGVRPAWAQPVDEDAFQSCVHEIYPIEVRRGERYVLRNFHLSEAQSMDLALGALLVVCEHHASRSPYPQLVAAYWLSLKRDAYKQVDPNRKHRREVPSSALGSAYVDCADREDLDARCPSPRSRPEDQVAAWEEIALTGWCDLNQLQRSVIIQKAVLEMSDDEIASEHTAMTPQDAKNTYQNTRRKARNKLKEACTRERTGWPDLLDGLP